jgi:quercetin dioxygenase-like cupin family protein
MTKAMEHSSVFTPKDRINYQEGGIVSLQITKNEAGNITLFAFDKGQGLSEHAAPFDAVVQVLEGQAEVIIDGESHYLSTNEVIIMPAQIKHALKATTSFKMMLTMIKGG